MLAKAGTIDTNAIIMAMARLDFMLAPPSSNSCEGSERV